MPDPEIAVPAPSPKVTRFGSCHIEELSVNDMDAFFGLYEIYSRVFPMPDEREPPSAFREILNLNRDARIQTTYGPYREIVATVRRWEGGPVIGGHIFGVTTSECHRMHQIPGSIQAIYTFLHEDNRGEIPIKTFVEYCQQTALRTFPSNGRLAVQPLIFFEVNNPLKMTAEEIDIDTKNSGLDPHRRYMFWLRSGFRPLDFPYVQPRLRPDAEPVRCLDLFCGKATYETVPANVLERHLQAFISISVLKGRNAADDPDYQRMQQWLRERSQVKLVPADNDSIRKIVNASREARARSIA
jgi:hypothetical protein